MTEARAVSNAAEMLPFIELTDIRVYEVAGRRATETEDHGERATEESLSIQARGSETSFETRARMLVRTEDADLVADAAALYEFREPLAVTEEVAAEFVERVGVMAVYPFLREQIFTTATRLGVAPPVIGLLRAGEFKVEAPEPEAFDS